MTSLRVDAQVPKEANRNPETVECQIPNLG